MTKNQANQLAKSPNTKKALLALVKYARLEAQLKAAKAEADEANIEIRDAMIENGVTKIEIDNPQLTGYITLVERTTYKAKDISEVDTQFTKVALDTKKVAAQKDLTGELPAGVEASVSKHITKKLKEV